MTDFLIKLNPEQEIMVKKTINIIKKYHIDNEKLKQEIKENNEEIKNEYKAGLLSVFENDEKTAKIVLKHAKDSALAETMASELETVKFLKDIIYV
jgi:hypothetical protein